MHTTSFLGIATKVKNLVGTPRHPTGPEGNSYGDNDLFHVFIRNAEAAKVCTLPIWPQFFIHQGIIYHSIGNASTVREEQVINSAQHRYRVN